MKKQILCLIFALITVLGLTLSSAAINDEANNAAQTLYELGLFKGTGTNPDGTPIFSLDRVPTRNQAIIMLVRLLGKEQDALNGTWELPFTDVSKTSSAYPYIGYAYTHGLTSGTSATTYSGSDPVRSYHYITFVLRALGYESGKDFRVSKAWELSDKLGLTDGRYNASTTDFLRSDIALISAATLHMKMKDSEDTLLTTLEKAGAVTIPQSPSSTLMTSGQPNGQASVLQHQETNELSNGTGTIHGATMQLLDNGHTRFTVEYTMPAGLSIFIFDPPNGEKISMWDTLTTSGQKSELVFDVDSTLLTGIQQLTVNFYTSDQNRFLTTLQLAGNNSTGQNVPSTGTPIDTVQSVRYDILTSTLSSGKGTIHDITMQPLNNGHTRFTVEYTMPAGLNISVSQGSASGITNGQRSSLAFDVNNAQLAQTRFIQVNFTGSGSDLFVAEIWSEMIWPTDGKATGAAVNVSYTTVQKLSSGQGIVHGLTSQPLDNGHTRFTLKYTVPAGLRILIYDVPNGEKISMREDVGTSGQESTLVFDIENTLLSETRLLVVNFFRSDSNCFWVEF